MTAGLSPGNGKRLASNWYVITPSDQMSLRASTVRPKTCSGDMYESVPENVTVCVVAPGLTKRGSPKSTILASPLEVENHIGGFDVPMNDVVLVCVTQAFAIWRTISMAAEGVKAEPVIRAARL